MPPRQDNSRLAIICAVLAVCVVISSIFGTGILALGQNYKALFLGEKLISNLLGRGGGGASPCPGNDTQKFRNQVASHQALLKNIDVYKAAASENNVPWEMIAALHYREHGLATDDPNGEGPFQLTTYYTRVSSGNPPDYKGKAVTKQDIAGFESSARLAAQVLQEKSGHSLTANASDADIKDAFWGYNGRAYGSADRSPYVMNNFDAEHVGIQIRGKIRDKASGRLVEMTPRADTNDGAFTVYYLLHYLAAFSADSLTFKDCTQVASGTGGATQPTTGAPNSVADVGNGKWLKVPGVSEGKQGDCGHASVIMLARFYNPSFTDRNFYDPASNETIGGNSCVAPGYLNSHTPHNDWQFGKPSKDAGIEAIKRSIDGGDPVIFYGNPGLIYSGKHIFVIVGYDATDHTFIINNPNVGSCDCYPDKGPTKRPNGKLITEDRLKQYMGGFSNSPYDHSLQIRSIYLK